ncbi:hypothetical protein FQN50_004762 [Emmonsiellopsis sp. PD_5]|nr:hypothetical protein FQN50_004762 [Emmonsiellopsis sp. PD_5]
MKRVFRSAETMITGASKKFTSVTVSRGGTTYPKAPADLLRLGIRWDFDGEITIGGILYNKFQVQPNVGKVPPSVSEWRKKNGGTHAVMGTMLVKKGGTEEDVKEGWNKFLDEFSRK